MPSDSNGVYTLPGGYLAVTGETIQASQHNPPLEDLATALSGRLPRSGAAAMLGPFKSVSGTAAAPGITFSGDTTTGFYRTASGGLGVAVAGALVAEFVAGGGMGHSIGDLIDTSLSQYTPPLCVRPYGQTLSRTTYAALWVKAQAEIAAGNTFYNNGDGTTTFGIADMRGRFRLTRDNLGGVAAGRVTAPYFGAAPTVVGATGGAQLQGIVTANLPPYTPQGYVMTNATPNGTISDSRVRPSTYSGTANSAGATTGYWNGGPVDEVVSTYAMSFAGIAQGGISSAFGILNPSIVTDCVLFAGA